MLLFKCPFQKLVMFLIDELKIKKFVPITNWEEIYQKGRQKFIQIMDPNNIVKIDLNLNMTQGKSTEMYELVKELSFPNRVRGKVLDLECWIQSKEDFILAKLLYKGYQDYKDALACWIRYQTELDIQFLEVSAKALKSLRNYIYLCNKSPLIAYFLIKPPRCKTSLIS